MIISPPFLSAAQPQQNDAMSTADAGNTVVPDSDVCAVNMLECSPGNGAYPVSFNLGWHGGAHLIAPTDGNQPASVRAIADGKIVHVRATDTTKSPALQYRGVRTDDGCVVIRHDTEIGEGDNAKITFYSVYMHLQNVMPTLAVGKKIYRKDILGTPGQIYGQFPQIHFEIVCDEANLKKIIGREPGPVGQTGRTDAVYGDIWFFVPRGAKIFAKEPHPYRDDDSAAAVGSLHEQSSIVGAGTSCDLVVRMRYDKDSMLTTYVQDAGGNWSASGAMATESDAEYNLYKRATGLQSRYNDGSLAGVTGLIAPSPSAIFEMIRFGRCIGDQIPNGARFNHWRKVNTPDAEGWVNLSMAGVRVYSDADFPEWAGWSFIKDDPTPDSLCDSPTVKQWLDVNNSGRVTHADAVGALSVDTVKQRLSHAVCKFPSEWSREGLSDRYLWLKSSHEALSNPLSDSDFSTLMEHARALGFWEDITDPDLPPANDCWRFPPTAFLRQLRKCDWLSLDELTQLLPRHYGLNQARSRLDWHTAQGRLSGNPISYADVCKAFRKYRISTANRRIAFLSQAYIETGLLRTTAEDGEGRGASGNAKYYRPFYGRGLMQITWPVLYDDYGKFRGFQNNNSGNYADERITSTSLHDWSGPPSTDKEGRLHEDKRVWYPRYDPDLVASDGMSACDSAGYFLFWKPYMGTTNILRIADEGITTTTIGRISVLVNGGGSGYDDRQQYAAFLDRYLGDSTDAESSATLSYRKQKITSVSHPHKHLEWGEHADVTNVFVDFTPQRES